MTAPHNLPRPRIWAIIFISLMTIILLSACSEADPTTIPSETDSDARSSQPSTLTPTPTTVSVGEAVGPRATSAPLNSNATATPTPGPTCPQPRSAELSGSARLFLPFVSVSRGQDRASTASQAQPAPIFFAPERRQNGLLEAVSWQFPATSQTIHASFAFNGLKNGQPWERVWYFAEEELSRASDIWQAGPRGILSLSVQGGESGFEPGRYRLEIYVEQELTHAGEFLLADTTAELSRSMQIAYTSQPGPAPQINLLDTLSGTTQVLIEGGQAPAWSPDGQEGLLFLADEGYAEGEGLWFLNRRPAENSLNPASTLNLSQRTFFESVAWSPGRLYVATSRDEGGVSRLLIWDASTGQAHPGPLGSDPAWSPDGTQLAFRHCADGEWHISTIRVLNTEFDTPSLRHLTTGNDSQPAWSPDGTQLVFVRDSADNSQSDIFRISASGENLTQLTDSPGADVAPSWTPEGEVVFYSQRDGNWHLFQMQADGSNQRRLVALKAPADWLPDPPAVGSNVQRFEPTPTPEPKPRVQVPPGQGVLVVSNQQSGQEMTFTINNQENRVPPYQIATLPLPPGEYTWSASWPGREGRSGRAIIVAGQAAYPIVER